MVEKNKMKKEDERLNFELENSKDAVSVKKENKAHNIKKQALGPNTKR
jgi:hypothetical protein